MKYNLPLMIILIILNSCGPELDFKEGDWDEWIFTREGEGDFYKASVPGCIHTDLLANELIEDPFFGDNESELQWVGESNWTYIKYFIPNESIFKKDNISIIFEGLDTYADVYLNDSLILKADNMYRKWEIDIKGILQKYENILVVNFLSPLEINKSRAAELSYSLPDERVFTRKAPYQFGWDWGPEFVTCGIWKPVYFRAWDDFRIERVHIDHGDIDEIPLPVKVNVWIESDKSQSVNLKIFNDDNNEDLKLQAIELIAGMNKVVIDTHIDDPELWWPAGLGTQKMYTFRTEVSAGSGSDEASSRFGIREIELVREPDEYGESFLFKVNGLAVFMKGANYIPQDNFLTRVNKDKYENLLNKAIDANMNMLRVWGGGIYENDIFYDLCDEKGILVWQDFMFACAMYPGDENFLESVEQEAIDNVSRLSNHPSIALWCGNNEIDEGWHNWGWQKQLGYSPEDSAGIWRDYLEVFHKILPAAVEKYDPGTIYWPSSPMTGWGRDRAYTHGDVHYWGVWWGEEPFEMYRSKVGRFVSEYGFQGMPPMETIRSFTYPDSRHLGSKAIASHQKHPRGAELIQKYMEREYMVPDDFEDYVYVSQVLQAEGMAEGFLSHRISQPYCMGTLYWQLNDCWPVTSWSGIDYYGNRKALHYHVKRAFSPIMVSTRQNNSLIEIYAVNDHKEEANVDLTIQISTLSGELISEKKTACVLAPLSNQKLSSLPQPLENREKLVLMATLSEEDSVLSRSYHYFVPTKELNLPDPEIKYLMNGETATVYLRALRHARQVFLEIPGYQGNFEDNFFDMAAGESREIRFDGEGHTRDLFRNLKIKSIYDTYH